MTIKPKCINTGIGSMPFIDPEYAVDLSLRIFSEAPFWPQLPRISMKEQMEIQYSEGLPCVVIDKEKERMYFDTSGDYSDALAKFFEDYMTAMDPDAGTGDCSVMAISPEYSAGLHTFAEHLQASGAKLPFVKVQTTGPCSFALTICDENKRAIYYNDEFREVIIKAMAMKCRWQIQKFKPFADQVICFIDEPILSAFGSSTYVTVQRDDVVAHLSEVIEAVHKDNALAGIHCCGNTEWSILMDAGVDIISFDAFEYGDTLGIYQDALEAFINKGGMIAWGIIPTSGKIQEQTAESIVERLEDLMDALAAKGIDKQALVDQAFITPSCGTGTMSPEDAEMVFEITKAVSQLMREKYAF